MQSRWTRTLLLCEELEDGKRGKTMDCQLDVTCSTWDSFVLKLKGLRGLPIGQPRRSLNPVADQSNAQASLRRHVRSTDQALFSEPTVLVLDPTTLMQRLRQHGFTMEILLPACLHPSGLLSPEFQKLLVEGDESWQRVLSCWPQTSEGIQAMLLNLCFMRIKSPAFSTQMTGFHGMWEIACMSSQRATGQTFSEIQLQFMVNELLCTFKLHGDKAVGRATSGACLAAALWWILLQPSLLIRDADASDLSLVAPKVTRSNSADSIKSEQALNEATTVMQGVGLNVITTTSGVSLGSNLHAMAESPSKESNVASSGMHGIGGSTSGIPPEIINADNRGSGAPARVGAVISFEDEIESRAVPTENTFKKQSRVLEMTEQQIIQGLLRCGLLPTCVEVLGDVCRLANDKNKSWKMQRDFRGAHRTLAAAWSMGALRQALIARAVSTAMSLWCTADLDIRRMRARRVQQQQEEQPGDLLPPSFTKYQALFTVLGLAPDTLWSSLLSVASLPASMCLTPSSAADGIGGRGAKTAARRIQVVDSNDETFSQEQQQQQVLVLLPMTLEEALTAIQRAYKTRFAQAKGGALRSHIRSVMFAKKSANAVKEAAGSKKQSAPSGTSTAHQRASYSASAAAAPSGADDVSSRITDADREAARWAVQYINTLDAKAPEEMLALRLSTYFDYPATYCPGVAASEALLAVLHESPQHLDHFLEVSDPSRILRLLEVDLPLRVQHIACILISLFLRGGVVLKHKDEKPGNPSESRQLPNSYLSQHSRVINVGTKHNAASSLSSVPHRRHRLLETASLDNVNGHTSMLLVHQIILKLKMLISFETKEIKIRYGGKKPFPAPQPGPRSYKQQDAYSQSSLVDERWSTCGDLVSVHAAVCIWGSCDALMTLAQEEETKRLRLVEASRRGSVATSSWNDQIANLMATTIKASAAVRGQAAKLSAVETSIREILILTASGIIKSPWCGPATHILCTAIVRLSLDPCTLGMLVKLGLIDRGDEMPEAMNNRKLGRGGSTMGRRSNSQLLIGQSATSAAAASHLAEEAYERVIGGAGDTSPGLSQNVFGLADCHQGLVGRMVETGRPDHAECAAALIALSAMGGHLHEAARGVPAPPGLSLPAAGSLSSGRLEVDSSGPHHDSSNVAAASWPRRVLRAGGWRSLMRCLGSQHESEEMLHVVSVGLMYLAKEMESLYSQYLARVEERGLRAETAELAAVEAATTTAYIGRQQQGFSSSEPLEMTKDLKVSNESSTFSFLSLMSPGKQSPLRSQSPTRMSTAGLEPSLQQSDQLHTPHPFIVSSGLPFSRGQHMDRTSATSRISFSGVDFHGPSRRNPEISSLGRRDAAVSPLDEDDLHCLYSYLCGDEYKELSDALEIAVQLLTSANNSIIMYAGLTIHHLASLPGLREPFGEAGAVEALVAVVRRWIDSNKTERRDQTRAVEWVMAALLALMEGVEGAGNLDRFAASWKPVEKASAALEDMRGFGYPLHGKPGTKPAKPVRTAHSLVCSTLWSGYGWGKGQVDGQHLHESFGRRTVTTVKSSSHNNNTAAQISAAKMGGSNKQDNAGYWDGETGEAAEQGPDDDDDASTNSSDPFSGSSSATDPINLMVQVVDVRNSKPKTLFANIKRPALRMLKYMSKIQQYRIRMVEAGAGPRLFAVPLDPVYDGRTRACACAIWMAVGETPEGKDPRWWGGLLRPGEVETAKAGPHGESAVNRLHLRAQALLQVEMLGCDEPEQETVGAKGATSLLWKGDDAKAVFIECGGLQALIKVASSPRHLSVLVPVCRALLNLSSYIPVQVEMCRSTLQLLLHLNSKYTGLNGYSGDDTRTRNPLGGSSEKLKPFNELDKGSAVKLGADEPDELSFIDLQRDLLYATSGTLYNLSRHPENLNLMYALELRVKTRRAASDLLIAASSLSGHQQVNTKSDSFSSKRPSQIPYSTDNEIGGATSRHATASLAGAETSSSHQHGTNLQKPVSRALQPVPVQDVHLTRGQEEALISLLSEPLMTVHAAQDADPIVSRDTFSAKDFSPTEGDLDMADVDGVMSPTRRGSTHFQSSSLGSPSRRGSCQAGWDARMTRNMILGQQESADKLTHGSNPWSSRGDHSPSTRLRSVMSGVGTPLQHPSSNAAAGYADKHYVSPRPNSAASLLSFDVTTLSMQASYTLGSEISGRSVLKSSPAAGRASSLHHMVAADLDRKLPLGDNRSAANTAFCHIPKQDRSNLPTLTQNLCRPRSEMWAPLLVDAHDQTSGLAHTLFEMSDSGVKTSGVTSTQASGVKTSGVTSTQASGVKTSGVTSTQAPPEGTKNGDTTADDSLRHEALLQSPPLSSTFEKASLTSILKKNEAGPVLAVVTNSATTIDQQSSQGGHRARTPTTSLRSSSASLNIAPKAVDRHSSRWRPLVVGCGSVKNQQMVPRTVEWKFQDGRGASVNVQGYIPSPSLVRDSGVVPNKLTSAEKKSSTGGKIKMAAPAVGPISTKGLQSSPSVAVGAVLVPLRRQEGQMHLQLPEASAIQGPAEGSIAWKAQCLVGALESKMRSSKQAVGGDDIQATVSDLPHASSTSARHTSAGGINKTYLRPGESLSHTQQQRSTTHNMLGGGSPKVGLGFGSSASRSGGRPRVSSKEADSPASAFVTKTATALVSFQTPHVTMWSHVPGNKIHLDIPVQELSNGEGAYLYRHQKTRVDEVSEPHDLDSGLGFDNTLPNVVGIDSSAYKLLRAVGELPFVPQLPQLLTPTPPPPGTHTLPPMTDLLHMAACLVPNDAPPQDAPFQAAVAASRAWGLDDSIFSPKPRENDSKGFYDKEGMEADVFDLDWQGCLDKSKFSRMLGKHVPSEEMMARLVAELRSRNKEVLRVFDFYASLGAGDSFAMHINSWGELMMVAYIADDESVNCKLSDCDRVFLATNFEEDKSSEASKNNLDNALIRSEFIEALVRVAIMKFLEVRETLPGSKRKGNKGKKNSKRSNASVKQAGQVVFGDNMNEGEGGLDEEAMRKLEALGPCEDIVEACTRLLDQYIFPYVPPESRLDANVFRNQRLYTEDVDIYLKEKKLLLRSIFDHYRQLANASDDMFLDLPEWLELMEESGLYHKYYTVREAKLAFIWSRMRCFDESSTTKAFQRNRSLTFLEFLEAVGRVADMVSPPTLEDLAESGCTSSTPTAEYYKRGIEQVWYLPDRESANICAPKTRPLDQKIEQVLEVMYINLLRVFHARDEPHLLTRLKQRRGKQYQLGKSAM